MSLRSLDRSDGPHPRRWRQRATVATAGLLATIALLASCSASEDSGAGDRSAGGDTPTSTSSTTDETTTSPPSTAPPTAGWETIGADDAGMDAAALAEITEAARVAGSNCFLVARDGRIVTESYWNGTSPDSTQEVFSASKSVTSTLVGIAHHDGRLDVTDHASTYLPEWRGTPSDTVTVEHLLSNDSGRHQDARTDYVEMAFQAPDKTAFSIGLAQDAEPGTVWAYNNAAIQTLEAVLSTATGVDVAQYAQDRLFAPLGMAHSSIRRDAAGNPLTFMGVQSNCRDLARFGELMLRDGDWDGETIVDADWVAQATGRSSQELNSAYGWLWWVNRPGTVLGALQATGAPGTLTGEADAGAQPLTEPGSSTPSGEGGVDDAPTQLVPGAPEDMFWALGFGNQVLAVDPGSHTLVVRLGPPRGPADAPKFDARASARVVTEALTDR